MAMEDFAREIYRQSKGLGKAERIARTKKLAASPDTKKFIQKYLPELYAEAFPPLLPGSLTGPSSHRFCP